MGGGRPACWGPGSAARGRIQAGARVAQPGQHSCRWRARLEARAACQPLQGAQPTLNPCCPSAPMGRLLAISLMISCTTYLRGQAGGGGRAGSRVAAHQGPADPGATQPAGRGQRRSPRRSEAGREKFIGERSSCRRARMVTLPCWGRGEGGGHMRVATGGVAAAHTCRCCPHLRGSSPRGKPS